MDPKHKNRILVVDDEAKHRQAIRRVLLDLDVEIRESENGKEALETAKTFRPDLVILDILMPVMDGYAVCQKLRGDPETAAAMILLLSARPHVTDRLKGYEAGADDYLIKPFDPEELKAKCRILCRLKGAGDQMVESEKKFRGMASSAIDAVIILDDRGMVSYWNRSAERIFGFKSEEIMEKDFHRLVLNSGDYDRFKKGFALFCATGKGAVMGGTREVQAFRKGNIPFSAEISLSALKLNGRWHSVGIVRDISERKEAERQIREAHRAADAANRAKGEFLASMSHEIRTPMNAIIGMTDLALDTDLDKTQRDYMETVRDAADALLTLLNDILDFSKIESGRVDLEQTTFDIRECLSGFLKPLAFGARRKGLELVHHVDAAVPEKMVGDPGRLRQIIVNLVGNAVKFTQEGQVKVSVDSEKIEDGGVRLHFAVSDTGIGIPAHRLNRIFEPFTQADDSITRKYGGTGLGLVISKALAELMGGRMWVESRPNRGSVFHFNALFALAESSDILSGKPREDSPPPAARVFTGTPETPSGSPVSPKIGLRILLAEDNAVNRKLALVMLKKAGYAVKTVENGKEAVRALEEGVFDLVLMDVQMPVMDGVEATRKIRGMEEKTGEHIPIVALTANAMKGDRERYLKAGMDDYMTKPFKWELLRQIIESNTEKNRRDKTP